jgi:hypothetical protein
MGAGQAALGLGPTPDTTAGILTSPPVRLKVKGLSPTETPPSLLLT